MLGRYVPSPRGPSSHGSVAQLRFQIWIGVAVVPSSDGSVGQVTSRGDPGVHVTLGFVGAGGDKTFGQREGYVYRRSCCRGVFDDNDMLAYSDAEVADVFCLLDVGVG